MDPLDLAERQDRPVLLEAPEQRGHGALWVQQDVPVPGSPVLLVHKE